MAAEESRRKRTSKARLGAVDGHRNRWYRGADNGPGRSMEEIQREESEKEQALHAIAKVAALQEQERREAEAALAAVAQFEQKSHSHRGNSNAKRRNSSGGRRKSNPRRQQSKKQIKGGKGTQMLVGMVPIEPGTFVGKGKSRQRSR